ncbi:MAG: hypothetical protein ACKVOM_03105, partial [Ferruginibacter sp.]
SFINHGDFISKMVDSAAVKSIAFFTKIQFIENLHFHYLYRRTEKNNDILADTRTTLYWNPYLNSDKENKKVIFSFYNNDNAKKFKVVVEGIQEDGKFLHIEKVLE